MRNMYKYFTAWIDGRNLGGRRQNGGISVSNQSGGGVWRLVRRKIAGRLRFFTFVLTSALICAGAAAFAPNSLAKGASGLESESRITSDSVQNFSKIDTHYNYSIHTDEFSPDNWNFFTVRTEIPQIDLNALNQDASSRSAAPSTNDSDLIRSAWLGNFSTTVVSIEAVRDRIVEGELAQFRITSSRISPQLLSIEFERTGDVFADFESMQQLSFCECGLPNHMLCTTCDRSTSNVRIISVPTIDDNIDEPDGSVIARLITGSQFEIEPGDSGLQQPLGTATIHVADNDDAGAGSEATVESETEIPRVSITARSFEVIEGEPVIFDVVSTAPLNYAVEFQVFTEGDFFTDQFLPTTVRLNERNRTTITMNTVNDQEIEPNGKVRLVLRTYGEQYYAIDPDFPSDVTVFVLDNDELSHSTIVFITADEERVVEGEPARFRLISTIPTDVSVSLSMSVRGDFFTGEELPTSVGFNGGTEVYIEVPTVDDSEIELSGQVHATILEDVDYSFNSDGSNAATVVVESNDNPRVSIEPVESEIFEGSLAQFRISSTLPLEGVVNLNVWVSGNYFSDPELPNSIDLNGGTEVLVEVPTVNDSEFGYSGRVYAKILQGEGYSIANPIDSQTESHVARVIVQNNDPRIDIDDELPIVWIEPVNPVVTEGEPAVIRVRTSHPTQENLNVELPLTISGGDMFRESPEDLPGWIEISGSVGETSVLTDDDSIHEQDGILTARLLPGPGYRVHQFEGREAVVLVKDNDEKPVVSVTTEQESAVEGSEIFYSIRATGPVPNVRIRYGYVGYFFNDAIDEFSELETMILEDDNQKTVGIQLTDDRVQEEDGEYYVEIQASEHYDIDRDNSRLSIALLDDDTVSVSLHSNWETSVDEGQSVVFHVESETVSQDDIDVTLRYSDLRSGERIESYATVTLPANQNRSSTHTFVLEYLESQQEGRQFIAQIEGNGNYQVAEGDSGEIVLSVQDVSEDPSPAAAESPNATEVVAESAAAVVPEISISLNNSESIEEGESIELVLNASDAPLEDLRITVLVEQFGDSDFLEEGLEQLQVTLVAGNTLASIPVVTVDDEVDEENGFVMFEIVEGLGYTPGDIAFAELLVRDNETLAQPVAAAASTPAAVPEVSLNLAENAPIEEDNAGDGRASIESVEEIGAEAAESEVESSASVAEDLPEVSVEALPSNITEGVPARFRIKSFAPVNLTVNFSIRTLGQFFTDAASPTSVRMDGISTIVEIPTVDDQEREWSGRAFLTIVEGEGYSVADEPEREAVVVIEDNDFSSELPTISMAAENAKITEGVPARFRITSSFPTHVAVNISMRTRGNYFTGQPLPTTVAFEGATEAYVEVPTVNDSTTEWSGRVFAKLMLGDGYLIAGTDGNSDGTEIEIIVEDFDLNFGDSRGLPTLWVEAVEPVISEGQTGLIRLRSSRGSWTLVGGANLSVNPTNNVFPPDFPNHRHNIKVPLLFKGESILRFETENDAIGEPSGAIEVTLHGGAGYSLPNDAGRTARITIKDDDSETRLGIEAVAESVVEGDPVQFRIESNRPYSGTVNLSVTSRGDYFPRSAFPNSVVMDNATEAFFEIPTVDDRYNEWSGRVFASIQENQDEYELAAGNSEAFAIVENNDIVVASIVATPHVDEDGLPYLTYRVVSEVEAITDVQIEVRLFVAGELSRVLAEDLLVIPQGQTASEVRRLNFSPDFPMSSHGRILARILPGINYVPSDEFAYGSEISFASLMGSISEAMILDRRVVSITSNTESITEGDQIQITVSSNLPVDNVELLIQFFDGFFEETSFEETFNLSGKNERVFTFSSIDDDVAEKDGLVLASLKERSHYEIDGENFEVDIEVLDNDSEQIPDTALVDNDSRSLQEEFAQLDDGELPYVWIEPVRSFVTEGETVEIRVISSRSVEDQITVEVPLTVSGGDMLSLPENELPRWFLFVGSGGSIPVFTVDDENFEEDTVVRARIVPGSGYRVHDQLGRETSITVLDNDVDPTRAIPQIRIEVIEPRDIVEGEPARFEFLLSEPFERDYTINIFTRQTELNPVISGEIPLSVRIPAAQTRVEFEIPTEDDNLREVEGIVQVELLPGRGYEVIKPNTGVVSVRDNEPESLELTIPDYAGVVLSMHQLTPDFVEEGSELEVIVRSSEPVPQDLKVYLTAEDNLEISNADFINEGLVTALTIPVGETEVSWTVQTVNDRFVEGNGEVILRILPSSGYRLGPSNIVFVDVVDNDPEPTSDDQVALTPLEIVPPPVVIPFADDDDFAEDLVVESTSDDEGEIADEEDEEEPAIDSLPTVSIESLVAESIYEGEIAEFVLLLSEPQENDLTVNVVVTEGEGRDFVDEETMPVTIAALQPVVVFELFTVDDDEIEADGIVELEIEPGPEFMLGLSNATEFTVKDNDNIEPLEISIASLPQVKTGDLAEFRIISNRTSAKDVVINVSVQGEGLLWSDLDLTVPLIAGESEARLFVPTGDRDVGNDEVSVAASVVAGEGYVVSQTEGQTSVRLQDTIASTVISIVPVDNPVDEGELAKFEIHATQVHSVPVVIWTNVEVSRRGLPPLSEVRSVELPVGEQTYMLEIPTSSSFGFTGTSEVKVTLLRGDAYELDSENEATVAVNENLTPVISVASQKESGVEGEEFGFDFEIIPATAVGFRISLEITQEGDFISPAVSPADRAAGRTELAVNPGTDSVSLNIRTADDSENEDDGRISITILEGEGYRIQPTSNISAESIVQDNDAPRISVVKGSGQGDAGVQSITEGEGFEFSFVTLIPLQNDLEINFALDEAGGAYVASGTELRTTLQAGTSSVSVLVQTEDDEVDEADGSLTVSLLPGEGYNVDEIEEQRQTSVSMLDNDDLTVISISAVSESVVEGEPAQFELTTSGLVYRDISISVFSSLGDFVTEDPPISVFMQDTTSLVFEVPTDDDGADELDGDINVTILETDGYIINQESNLATVLVSDNDEIPIVSVAYHQFDTVVEGSTIQFELTANRATHSIVNVIVSGSQEVATIGVESIEVDFDGQDSVIFEVVTQNSDEFTEELVATALILPGDSYVVAAEPNNSAAVTIIDAQVLPEISIVASDATINEGERAEFVFSATFPNYKEVAINVQVEGDFLAIDNLPESISFDYTNSTVLSFDTIDDDSDEFNGLISVGIVPNSDVYTIAGDSVGFVATQIIDDDLPVLSIKASVPYAVDGDTIEFTVEAQSPVSDDLSLSIEIWDGGTDTGKSHFQLVSIAAGRDKSTVAGYFVPEQETYDFNRRITAEIVSQTDFTVADEGLLTTVYLVGQSLPVISIEPVETYPVQEGSVVNFRLKTLYASAEDLPVQVKISDGGAEFINRVNETTIIFPAGEKDFTFNVRTIDDLVDRNNAVITAVVIDEGGYNLDTSYSNFVAETTVLDNDVPVLSITGGGSVLEGSGDAVEFTVSSNIVRDERDLVVYYRVDQGVSNLIDIESQVNAVKLPTGGLMETATIEFDVIDDRIDENTGEITVTLLLDTGVEDQVIEYALSEELISYSDSVLVEDDDVPVISIEAGNSVTEGDNVFAVYTVSSDIKREARDLNIAYSIDTGASNFLASTIGDTVVLDATRFADLSSDGSPRADDAVEIRLQIVNDRIDENHGSVTVSIDETNTSVYRADAGNGVATVAVSDDDVPVISIADGPAVIEGDNVYAVYTVASDIKREGRDLTIAYSIDTGTSNFLAATGNATIELAATPVGDLAQSGPPQEDDAVEIRLPIVNDRIDENNGMIAVTIETTDATIYISDTESASASVSVADDDVPELSITGGSSVTEGDNVFAVFQVASEFKREIDVRFSYSIDAGGSNFLSSTANATFELESTSDTDLSEPGDETKDSDFAEVRLPIVNDRIDENDGTIEVTLLESDTSVYTVDGTDFAASVSVDDDDVPVISIAGGPSVTEGDNVFATYTVISDIKRESRELVITYSINTGTGNFLAATADGTVDLAATPANELSVDGAPGAGDSAEISLPIVNDEINEEDGSISVTIVETNTTIYTASTSDGTASVSVADDDIPKISLSLQTGHSGEINEGESITFNLEASNAPWQDITVSASLTPTSLSFLSDYTPNSSGEIFATGTISRGLTTGTLDVETQSNDVNESDGIVTVELVAGTGYELDPLDTAKHTVVFTVKDDDKPIISISLSSTHSDGSVSEGDSVTFDITATIAPFQDIAVTAHLTPIDSVFLSDHTVTDETIAVSGTLLANSTTGTIVVATAENSAVDEDGTTITATLVDGEDYDVAEKAPDAPAEEPDPSLAAVVVSDDEAAPVISITGGSDVTEGTAAEFTVSADATRNVAITVNYLVTQGVSDDFIASSVVLDSSVQLPAGDSTVTGTISIATATDTDPETNGIITVTIDDPEESQKQYAISTTQGSANVNVLDDDEQITMEATPQISVAPMEFDNPNVDIIGQFLNEGIQLPLVSISAESVRIDEGEDLIFTVSADITVSKALEVSIAVDQGERSIIDDIIPRSVRIEQGKTETELLLWTWNDGLELTDGKVTVSIREESHYRVNDSESSATVTVTDVERVQRIARYQLATKNIIPETLTAMGSSLVDALASHVESAYVIGESNTLHLEVGGQSSFQDILQYKAQEMNDSAYSWASMLEDTSFRLPVEPSTDSDATVTGWGSGNYTLIDDNTDSVISKSGELYTANLGFDTVYRNGMLFGVTATYFESDIEFSIDDGYNWYEENAHRTQVTGLNPYIGWASEDRVVELWTSAGYGQGGIEIEEAGENLETMDSSYYIFAVGNSTRLFALDENLFGGEIEFKLRNEAWTSGMSLTNGTGGLEDDNYTVHRVRLATEGTHTINLDSGTYVDSEASAGIRWDAGDHNQGLGFEFGANMIYSTPFGLEVEPGARILMLRGDLLREWGLNSVIQYDKDLDSVGLQTVVSPTWGETNNGSVEQIWETGVFDDDDYRISEDYEAQMDTEIGYGFQVLDRSGTMTPFVGLNIREGGLHEYKLGGRLAIGTNFNLILESELKPPDYEDEDDILEFSANGSVNW